MRFGSLFAGIGGFDLGLERAGMQCAWQVEIDGRCRDVLSWRWPDVPRYQGVKDCGGKNLESIDLICGGFPCQDVSVAGRRAGLAGERSGLWSEFHRIIAELQPRWCIIENVPGLLSSNEGRDMGTILWSLGELGYGWAYRVLDAQYFSVAQRRRRVFIVGYLGDARRAAQVLFEPESCERNTPPSRETGARVATPLTRGSASGRGVNEPGRRREDDINLVATTIGAGYWAEGVRALSARDWRDGGPGVVVSPIVAMHETGQGWWNEDAIAGTLRAEGENRPSRPSNVVAYNIQQNDGGPHKRKDRPNGGMYVTETERSLTVGSTDRTVVAFQSNRDGCDANSEVVPTRSVGTGLDIPSPPAIAGSFGVRRLMPIECERLQGFPDNWTYGLSDSTRYRQLGNAVAVPVAEWIGWRIVEHND